MNKSALPHLALVEAVEALAKGSLNVAEMNFLAILTVEPTHKMANTGLKDVVRARVLANLR